MKEKLARALLILSALTFAGATLGLVLRADPFKTFYFLFAWWSLIFFLDSWLYLKGGESLFLGQIVDFFTFLLPFSAFLWFVFEAFNLRLLNWIYAGVPSETWIRWPGYFLAFATVLPAIFLIANALDHFGIFRKNEFSQFFSEEPSPSFVRLNTAGGALMLALPLLWPRFFFPLLWGGFVLLLDPINASWRRRSLLQEWRQKNWNRTLQLLLAGFICGGLWEFWNFWSGAKWVYTVPLPGWLMRDFKIFEMPLLGFLGFPPFALECFVMTEFARGLKERVSGGTWKALMLAGLLFSAALCRAIDLYTVMLFR